MSEQAGKDEIDSLVANVKNGDDQSIDLIEEKGKGKSIQSNADEVSQDISMDDGDSSSDDEGKEASDAAINDLEEEEDNMEEIDTSNIIPGTRTRGRTINFAKAAENMGIEDDDDEDDDDFESAEDEEMKD